VKLDSTFVPALDHLVLLAAAAGDAARTRQYYALYSKSKLDSVGVGATFLGWRAAVALGDSGRLAAIRSRFDEMSSTTLHRLISTAQLDGVALEDAERATAALRRRPRSQGELGYLRATLPKLELNRGRPAEAAALITELDEMRGGPGEHELTREYLYLQMFYAMYWDSDTIAAAQAARQVEPYAAAPMPEGGEWWEPVEWQVDLCSLEWWKTWRGDVSTTARTIAQLRSEALPPRLGIEWCPAILEAMLATAEGRPDARAAVVRLDSLNRLGLPFQSFFTHAAALTAARLYEAHGDPVSALAAVRRRPYNPEPFFIVYLSTFIREEGRLAALLGDRESAIRAYRHYLALRSDPEPALAPEVERVRAELARLVGESASN
jgi:hypothetical protein